MNVDTLQEYIIMGRLIPKENGLITMRDLLASGVVNRVNEGIKLLGRNRSGLEFDSKIHLEVSFASKEILLYSFFNYLKQKL